MRSKLWKTVKSHRATWKLIPLDRGGGVPIFRWDDNYRFGGDDFDDPTTNVHDVVMRTSIQLLHPQALLLYILDQLLELAHDRQSRLHQIDSYHLIERSGPSSLSLVQLSLTLKILESLMIGMDDKLMRSKVMIEARVSRSFDEMITIDLVETTLTIRLQTCTTLRLSNR